MHAKENADIYALHNDDIIADASCVCTGYFRNPGNT